LNAHTELRAERQRSAREAIYRNRPIIRKCNFCGTTPVRQLCARCERVRYCDHQCQLAHWHRALNLHKGHCRRLVPRCAAEEEEDGDGEEEEDEQYEASDEDEEEASDEHGGASSSSASSSPDGISEARSVAPCFALQNNRLRYRASTVYVEQKQSRVCI
jgi:hypothetical protein